MTLNSNRVIGIRHRRKKTAEGEARPTTVAIVANGKTTCYDLETETDELDFLLHRFPIDWENVGDNDVVWFDAEKAPNGVRPHQCKWKKISKDDAATLRKNHVRMTEERFEKVIKVPCAFEGLKQGDRIAMVLGGSGDRFASALSRRGESVEAEVFRIPPLFLSQHRGQASKDDDHKLLAKLLQEQSGLFHKLMLKDRQLIKVKEVFFLRQDAQRARIGCEQRLHQALVGRVFLTEEGNYPEGTIEDMFDQIKANDTILKGLLAEENRREGELKKAVQSLEVWKHVFEQIEGCGERIAAGLIIAIGDIRRFAVPLNGTDMHGRSKAIMKTCAKVKAICGAHLEEGKFPRRRAGKVANWSPLARQSLFLLGDQFNRRPASDWGKKLLWKKEQLRLAHPQPVDVEVVFKKSGHIGTLLWEKEQLRLAHPQPVDIEVVSKENGQTVTKKVKRYTDGHIHKMAQKWCATKFVEWVTRQWLRLEKVYEG